MFLKKLSVSAVAFTLLFSGIVGVNTADAARPGFDAKKVGGKVTFSSFADATRLTPNTTNDAVSNRIQSFIFDGLVKADKQNEIIPNVATSWKIENNNKTYTFTMRKDVKFHDGKPLTAHDVVFSYGLYMDPTSINPYKSTYTMIDKVTAVDNYTVKFELKDPTPLFLYASGAAILPKHQFPKGVEDFNKNSKIHRNPIGSGPFKFKEWRTAERIVVTANKDYWDGRPYLDEIVMRILPDQNVEVVNLLKGSVDFIENVDPKSVAQVTKNKNLKITKYDQGRFDYIGFNLLLPKFSDVKVRQALTLGLNRQALVDRIMLKNAQLASGPIHPLEAQFNKNEKALPYDVARANKLLDEAGWKIGKSGFREKNGEVFEIELTYNNGNKIREAIAKVAQQDWKKLGIKVTIRSFDFSIWLEKQDKLEIEAWVGAWGLGTNPDKYGLWHSTAVPNNNKSRVNDKRVDQIMEEFRKESNAAKRNAMYQELHKIMNENQYNLFMYHPKGFSGMHKDLAGVEFSLYSRFYSIQDWYWADPKKRK